MQALRPRSFRSAAQKPLFDGPPCLLRMLRRRVATRQNERLPMDAVTNSRTGTVSEIVPEMTRTLLACKKANQGDRVKPAMNGKLLPSKKW